MRKKIEKAMTLCIAALLVITATVSGTLAYLEYDAQKEKTTAVGMVQIDQREYERVSEDSSDLRLYTQDKALYPAVGKPVADVAFSWTSVDCDGISFLYGPDLKGEIDKFVFVENTGSRDAYIRTWFAFEQGSYAGSVLDNVIHINMNSNAWRIGTVQSGVQIDGNTYTVLYVDHIGPLETGKTSEPSLLQVYMDSNAGNDTVAAIDGNSDGRYEILVTSQAAEIDDLDALFPTYPSGTIANLPDYVDTFEEFKSAVENGNNIELQGDIVISETVSVPEGVSVDIDGNDFILIREEGFTGTMFQLEDKSTITMQNVTVDGGAEQGIAATGQLIASDGDATIILNGDAVLQNNNGANAIRFTTTYAGTLVMNGAQIRNNTSPDGAVYGCNSITVNEGSIISGNHSTGYGAAFRMVRGTLTLNGGQITNNTSDKEGGAIYAYQSCSFVLNGGEIAYNSTNSSGGAIWTGYSSSVTVSGTSIHHNTAAGSGGAIRLVTGATLTMNSGKIYENYAVDEGGAVYGWNSSAKFIGGEIVNNSCLNGAGGVHMNNKNYEILGAITVQDNYTTSTNTESNYNQ